ncbi:MAG: DUF2231 domain-containing protein [Chloroherpetonaceae bacterium]|nr:hypothetical protein [Chthonomonadaceae bacterium]MDW8207153.1 DUF2231 domain-containing protein [Chloroherpetonaceae bacterium]
MALLTGMLPCHAKPDYPVKVKTVYQLGANTAIQKASTACRLCHQDDLSKYNPYGADIQKAFQRNGKPALLEAAMRSVEGLDSDGDGVTNIDEIRADTLPGDPKSVPSPQSGAAATGAAQSPEKHTFWSELTQVFTPQSFLFPKHAQHPIVVHFPVALFFSSLFFDAIGFWRRWDAWRTTGKFLLASAVVTAVPSILTGLLAWRFKFGGAPLEGLLLYHLATSIGFTGLLCGMWWARSRYDRARSPGYLRLHAALAVLAVGMLTVAGHLGGVLVRGE